VTASFSGGCAARRGAAARSRGPDLSTTAAATVVAQADVTGARKIPSSVTPQNCTSATSSGASSAASRSVTGRVSNGQLAISSGRASAPRGPARVGEPPPTWPT
jgi:hypothetical protein